MTKHKGEAKKQFNYGDASYLKGIKPPQKKMENWEKMPGWQKVDKKLDKFYHERKLSFPEWMYQELVVYIYTLLTAKEKEGYERGLEIGCKATQSLTEQKIEEIRQQVKKELLNELKKWMKTWAWTQVRKEDLLAKLKEIQK